MSHSSITEDSDVNIALTGDTVRGKTTGKKTRTQYMRIGTVTETGLSSEDARVGAMTKLSYNPSKNRPIE